MAAIGRMDATDVRHYGDAAGRSKGGLKGGPWDGVCDVEYTFYGLGGLGLLT